MLEECYSIIFIYSFIRLILLHVALPVNISLYTTSRLMVCKPKSRNGQLKIANVHVQNVVYMVGYFILVQKSCQLFLPTSIETSSFGSCLFAYYFILQHLTSPNPFALLSNDFIQFMMSEGTNMLNLAFTLKN